MTRPLRRYTHRLLFLRDVKSLLARYRIYTSDRRRQTLSSSSSWSLSSSSQRQRRSITAMIVRHSHKWNVKKENVKCKADITRCVHRAYANSYSPGIIHPVYTLTISREAALRVSASAFPLRYTSPSVTYIRRSLLSALRHDFFHRRCRLKTAVNPVLYSRS